MLSVRTLADMARIITANLHRIDRGSYDCIVGVPRSGMIPASIIATMLQMPLADVEGYGRGIVHGRSGRSEEHTSELQSLMRISYAVFCLKKKQNKTVHTH